MPWETVIGLEVHVQLTTQSKIFSGASTAFGAPPNSQACGVDLALPGVLPVLNAEAVALAVRFGLAIGAELHRTSIFERKNYFYPDLPKGYQISQMEVPIVGRGALEIEVAGVTRTIGITRAHLEEDAGKSVHEDFHGATGIDLNRAGTPLLEVVSEPDLRSAEEAVAYLRALHALVCYLGVSDGNMAEGSFRCDANVSVRPAGSQSLGTRTEIKNINSFRFVEQAIVHEAGRQIDLLERDERVVQETRLYDPERNETRAMRSKEVANDYRYFPDPDLLPLELSEAYIAEQHACMPELPAAKRERYIGQLGIKPEDATLLTGALARAEYFEQVAERCGNPRLAANWVVVELLGALNRDGLDIAQSPVTALALGGLLERIEDQTISGKIAKQVFQVLWEEGGDADAIIADRGLKQVTDSGAIEAFVEAVIHEHPEQVEQFRAGKEKVLGFLVGQVMKRSQGKANPSQVNDMLRQKLAE
ncbi:MAG: Asp-tRNA(Asn)/Glu-tRNA(Gln) amidotransferase subunit GatB [Pseudomonadota bacterium]|nr:Asp-tRNA(Asn)/Glu-tRNA(Gln) amidotransferase subunit GatB [Pseudomonadota bacterium]